MSKSKDTDLEERLVGLESCGSVPGTVLARALLEDGIGWSLGVGGLQQPKKFFYGSTIEDVIQQAEEMAR